METIEPPDSASTGTEQEPNFLLVRDSSGDWPRWKRAAVGSVVFHVVGIAALFLIPNSPYQPPPPENLRRQEVIHLYVPKDLTQKAANKAPTAKMMMSEPSAPNPKLTEPKPESSKAFVPPPPAPKPAPPPPAIVPPTPVAPPALTPGEMTKNQIPAGTLPPAQLPRPDAPKMIVEDSLQPHPPAPRAGGALAPPNPITEANRTYGNMPAGNKAGDSGEISVGGGLHLPASAARLSNFELKSDPMGVDFQPYLQQVLAAVKMNWVAVFPEAARLGMRGTVTVEFAIGKDGTVEKIVFNGQSGSRALDNASVAAISASNKLPPLPRDFKGDRIVVQMSFMYNMPR